MTKLASRQVPMPRLGVGRVVHTNAPAALNVKTWCKVGNWDSVLTRRARSCVELGSYSVPEWPNDSKGALVRHWALAEQLDKGRDAVGNAARLTQMEPADKAGLAIAGPYRLAAEIINQHPLGQGAGKSVRPLPLGAHPQSPGGKARQQACAEVEAAWTAGARRAVATGTSMPVAWRRLRVYEALSIAKLPLTPADLELWDRHAATHRTDAVVLAIQAGYAASEVTAELLADRVGLAVAAALNANVGAA